jgi:hypothetical protein
MIRRIKVEFVEGVYLPRFKINKGAAWEVRPDRIERGGFSLGGGFIKSNQYKVTGIIK